MWSALRSDPSPTSAATGSISDVQFSPDGTRLLIASDSGSAALVDAGSGDVIRILDTAGGALWPAKFDPSGTRVVIGMSKAPAQVWDVETGKKLADLGTGNNVFEAIFNDDGTRIATNEVGGSVHLFDAETFAEIGDLSVAGTVGTIDFSADGTMLATQTPAYNQTFTLWSTSDGRSLGEYEGASVYFDPTSNRIATASSSDQCTVAVAAV